MKNVDFDTRSSSETITFTGTTQGETIPTGCFCTLQSGNVWVVTRVTNCSGDTYTGTVQSFENWDQPEWHGLKTGSEVTFTEDNIFRCDVTAVAA